VAAEDPESTDLNEGLLATIVRAYRKAPVEDPLQVFERNLASDCVFEDWVGDLRVAGAQEIRDQVYRPYVETYRDCRYEVEAVVRDGNRLVVSGVFHGRKRRKGGRESELTWRFRDLYEVARGQVTLLSVASDTLAVDRLLDGELA
jgi:hypothetical protein